MKTSGALLLVVPAFNEEAAVGKVVSQIHEAVPGVPVLVIDDCALDGDHRRGRAPAGAKCSPAASPGLGRAVQAGYKLAYESNISTSSAWMATGSTTARHPANSKPHSRVRAVRW